MDAGAFVDKACDDMAIKVVDGKLQWWKNDEVWVDIEDLAYDPMGYHGPTLSVPGSKKHSITIARPQAQELDELIASIAAAAEAAGVHFAQGPEVSFVDSNGDRSTLKLLKGELQWWTNDSMELDRIQALDFDARGDNGPVVSVPGHEKLSATVAGPQDHNALIKSISAIAGKACVQFRRQMEASFVDADGDENTLKLVDGQLQWWLNGSLALDWVRGLVYDRWLEAGPTLFVPGSTRFIASIVQPEGEELNRVIASITTMATLAGRPIDIVGKHECWDGKKTMRETSHSFSQTFCPLTRPSLMQNAQAGQPRR